MKLTFNIYYFIAFALLFAVEVCIAIFLKDGFIRYTFGDFLVVILLYCFFKSFIKINNSYVAIVTLIMAYSIELLQLTNITQTVTLKHQKWVSLVLGSHFSKEDLIAYTLGIISIYYIDTYFLSSKSQKNETIS